jgi:hypothetical protein
LEHFSVEKCLVPSFAVGVVVVVVVGSARLASAVICLVVVGEKQEALAQAFAAVDLVVVVFLAAEQLVLTLIVLAIPFVNFAPESLLLGWVLQVAAVTALELSRSFPVVSCVVFAVGKAEQLLPEVFALSERLVIAVASWQNQRPFVVAAQANVGKVYGVVYYLVVVEQELPLPFVVLEGEHLFEFLETAAVAKEMQLVVVVVVVIAVAAAAVVVVAAAAAVAAAGVFFVSSNAYLPLSVTAQHFPVAQWAMPMTVAEKKGKVAVVVAVAELLLEGVVQGTPQPQSFA